MLAVPIHVAAKESPANEGLVVSTLMFPTQDGQPIMMYGVYWDDANARQAGLDFRTADQLVWGDPLCYSPEGDDIDEEELEDETDETDAAPEPGAMV